MRHTSAITRIAVAEQVTGNVKRMEATMREAQERFRAELILFPETCIAEFSRGMTRELRAEIVEALDRPFVSIVQELTARFPIWTAFGFYERAETVDSENRSYNSALILGDRGEICGHYRKTHLYDTLGHRESDDYLRGEQLFRPIGSPFGKLGPFVCCELRLPEAAWVVRTGGAEILLMSPTWVRGGLKSEHFRTLLKARAVENTCYLLAANQHSKVRMGEGTAIDSMGAVAASAGKGETVFPTYLDSERLREVREKPSSSKDRREELYGSLSSNTMNRCQSEI